ncbi:MAG: hydrolase family protein [Candidatus Saccharibacteria bacterium]|nr:hydrolase family protein [Candidatus Saccharibacteria bacterium]
MKKRITSILIIVTVLFVAAFLFLFGRTAKVVWFNVKPLKNYWNQRASLPVPENALWYVVLGDSAAQGVGSTNPEHSYVGRIADALAQKTGRPVHVVNLSISGAKSRVVIDYDLPLFRQLDLPADCVVTLEIGGNNVAAFNEVTFRSEMDQIMSELPPQTVVADVPYFGGSILKSREPIAVNAGMIVHEVAAKHNLTVAPLHKFTFENDNWRVYSGDRFHPSNYGYHNWFKAFKEPLELPETN